MNNTIPVAAGGQAHEGDYEKFCRSVRIHTGLDLASYKRTQMERRIRAMADRVGLHDLTEYWRLLSRQPQQLHEFLDRVTINVSELFRNPEKYEELRTQIMPELLRETRLLSVWSAGCSYGAEAYSVRILLHQLTPGIKHRVWATDIDRGVLERAQGGVFTPEDMKHIPDAQRARYFKPVPEGFRVVDFLRDGVEFARHDLLRDAFPNGVDLILCRNVVIYFSDEAKARLFARFYDALRPGGYLLVGSTERIINAQAIGFTSPRSFFYQKPR